LKFYKVNNFKILSVNFKINYTNMHCGCGSGQLWLFNSITLVSKGNRLLSYVENAYDGGNKLVYVQINTSCGTN